MNSLSTPSEIAQALINGKVGVLPTDTVYGLVATVNDKTAVTRIYNIKKRDEKPGTIIAASVDQLVELGIERASLRAAEKYWPGAVSVVLPEVGLEYLHLGRNSLAVRIPDNQFLLQLLQITGPLVTSSANLSGQPVANNISEAFEYFGNQQVDFYVDGGDLSKNLPSTILKLSDGGVVVIRQGAVKL